jgi:hypothetical protein
LLFGLFGLTVGNKRKRDEADNGKLTKRQRVAANRADAVQTQQQQQAVKQPMVEKATNNKKQQQTEKPQSKAKAPQPAATPSVGNGDVEHEHEEQQQQQQQQEEAAPVTRKQPKVCYRCLLLGYCSTYLLAYLLLQRFVEAETELMDIIEQVNESEDTQRNKKLDKEVLSHNNRGNHMLITLAKQLHAN